MIQSLPTTTISRLTHPKPNLLSAGNWRKTLRMSTGHPTDEYSIALSCFRPQRANVLLSANENGSISTWEEDGLQKKFLQEL
jgi:hypothetical protein